MTNFYNNCSRDFVQKMRAYFLDMIAEAKRHHREYKTLEREVFKMTARLLRPDPDIEKCLGVPASTFGEEYDWQNRKDLQ